MPAASDYRTLLIEARKQQLADNAANIRRLEKVFDRAAQSLSDQLLNLPGFMLTEREALNQAYLHTLLNSLHETMRGLRADYAALLDASMLDTAQAAAAREARTVDLMEISAAKDPRLQADMSRSWLLTDGTQLTAQFGRVADTTVRTLAARYYRDGLKLSDRLFKLDLATGKAVEDTILQGITEGISARDMATRLQAALSKPGVETPRYQAMRIARTEINNAYRESTVQSAMDPLTGGLKGYLLGVRWNLSLSHPTPDICDVWAAHDEGAGPGVYQPGTVPVDHPHGLCFLTSELRDYPGVMGPGKAADAGAVPESQITYYANQGDAAASAAQAGAAAAGGAAA